MSRFRRVVHSVASGYVALAATAAFSLASVPLALHYLSTERFGLWSLMAGIIGYLTLIDLGMTSSLARLLIDHKDDTETRAYGSLIKTGWLVLIVQSAIILVAGFALAPAFGKLLAIETNLQDDFVQLLRWQCVTVALGTAVRMLNLVLTAHQRFDIVNYSQVLTLIANFALLWIFFHRGQDVFSLVWAGLGGFLVGTMLSVVVVWRLKLLPTRDHWGSASWAQFKEIFAFGKDLFLVSVGNQMLSASQTLIIKRQLGLTQAAVWYVGTRVFTFVCQALWRIYDVSSPAFSEMMVRKEQNLLRERYKTVLTLTASLSGAAAVIYALCNSSFVTVWTHKKIDWPPLNDVLMGIWMIILALVHCHNGFALLTKKVGFMRYIYFVEGLVFVATAFFTSRWGGMTAIIICSICCSTLFTGAYGLWRISDYFTLSIREVAWRWLVPMFQVLLRLAPSAVAWWWLCRLVSNPVLRVSLEALPGGAMALYCFLRVGLSRSVQRELLERAPSRINPLLNWLFGPVKAAQT